MSDRRSSEAFFQWAFAISPFPSYLPQYFSMIRQLSTIAEDDDGSGEPWSSDSSMMMDQNNINTNGSTATQQPPPHNNGGGDPLRKRTSMRGAAHVATSATISPQGMEGTMMLLSGTPSKSFEGGGGGVGGGEPDAGLSRATVLLLLSAHLLRLLHFHGVVLLLEEEEEEGSSVQAVEPASEELDGPSSSTGGATAPSSSRTETLALQWDLLGQSISMIVMQLMLLHTMMLLRRKHHARRPRERMSGSSGGGIARLHSADSLLSAPMIAEPPPRSGARISSLQGLDLYHGEIHHSPKGNGGSSSSSISRTKWHRLYRAATVHLLHLFSPSAILQTHSFLEYLELLLISSMTVKLVFDYHWYPRYGVHFVKWLKQTSIVLESCLALPQAVRNHRKGTTEGLSVSVLYGGSRGIFFTVPYLSRISSLYPNVSCPIALAAPDGDGRRMGCRGPLQVMLLLDQHIRGRQQRQLSICLGLSIFSHVGFYRRDPNGSRTTKGSRMVETYTTMFLALESGSGEAKQRHGIFVCLSRFRWPFGTQLSSVEGFLLKMPSTWNDASLVAFIGELSSAGNPTPYPSLI